MKDSGQGQEDAGEDLDQTAAVVFALIGDMPEPTLERLMTDPEMGELFTATAIVAALYDAELEARLGRIFQRHAMPGFPIDLSPNGVN